LTKAVLILILVLDLDGLEVLEKLRS